MGVWRCSQACAEVGTGSTGTGVTEVVSRLSCELEMEQECSGRVDCTPNRRVIPEPLQWYVYYIDFTFRKPIAIIESFI